MRSDSKFPGASGRLNSGQLRIQIDGLQSRIGEIEPENVSGHVSNLKASARFPINPHGGQRPLDSKAFHGWRGRNIAAGLRLQTWSNKQATRKLTGQDQDAT